MKEGWTYRQLKDVTNKVSDGSHNPPKGIAYSEYPMLSSKNILFDDFNYDSPRYLSKEDFDIENKRTDISDGDVLLTIVGTVGRTCCVQNPFIPFTLQRSVAVLKPKNEILISRFLMYVLYSLSDLWDNEAKGAAQKGVYLKQLAAVSIPIPPISEQERIVERLDAAFAQIDELKSNAEKQLAEARALFQSALTQAMQPKPGWQEKTLGNVGTFIRGGNFTKKDFVEDGFPCIHYGQIHTKFGVATYEHLSCVPKAIVKAERCASKGDLVIAITSEDDEGSCKCTAWMADYDAYVGGHTAIFKHCLNPIFVSYYFKAERFQKAKLEYTHGFKVVEISPKDIAKISISYPPVTEQQSIVDSLDSLKSKVDRLQENFIKISQECDALKQALLRQIFE